MYYAERALLLCQYYSQDQTLEQKLYDARILTNRSLKDSGCHNRLLLYTDDFVT